MSGEQPVFYYDLYSPYAYLAALRVDELLPVEARWQPIVFGALLRETGRTPWSLRAGDREDGQQEVQRRAHERGVGEVRWPPGWPAESYSVLPLRAIVWAGREDAAAAKRLSMALYEIAFGQGRSLADLATVREAVDECGLNAAELASGTEDREVKDALRANTSDAIARGVTGIPTVAVGELLYWGDDRLEEVAAALGERPA